VVDETETVDSKKRGREGEGEDERVIRLFLSLLSFLRLEKNNRTQRNKTRHKTT